MLVSGMFGALGGVSVEPPRFAPSFPALLTSGVSLVLPVVAVGDEPTVLPVFAVDSLGDWVFVEFPVEGCVAVAELLPRAVPLLESPPTGSEQEMSTVEATERTEKMLRFFMRWRRSGNPRIPLPVKAPSKNRSLRDPKRIKGSQSA